METHSVKEIEWFFGIYIMLYIYNIFSYIIFIYVLNIKIGHKWSIKHIVFKSNRSKMGLINMQSWKQCDHRLSPQWLCGNSCAWAQDIRLGQMPIVLIIRRGHHCFYDCTYIYIYIHTDIDTLFYFIAVFLDRYLLWNFKNSFFYIRLLLIASCLFRKSVFMLK